jgi:hypothetical protein
MLGVCALLVLAVALVFGPSLQHGFVNFDDNDYVYANPQVVQGLLARQRNALDACARFGFRGWQDGVN